MPTIPSWIESDEPIADPFGYGERNVQWLRRLKHPKSRAPGKAFQLDPWQERIIRAIYGPRHTEDDPENQIRAGDMIVRRVCLVLPRGNRKTSLGAAITLLHLIGPEKTPGDLIISAASANEQSRELYQEAELVIDNDPRLRKNCRILSSRSTITFPRAKTRYRALSADAKVQHGKTPRVIIADELHVWQGNKGRELWKALKSSTVKQSNVLMVIATTSGRGQDNLAWEEVSYALKVQKGEIIDPATLPVIFMAEKDDDWESEALWRAVNPGLKYGYPHLPSMRDEAKKAKHSPSDRDTFQQYNLCRWLDKSYSPFVDMDVYDLGGGPIDMEALEGAPCWIALDASYTTDLTAVVAVFAIENDEDDEPTFVALPHFFVPENNLRRREEVDKVPYMRWRDEGFLTATPGNVIDYRAVELCIRDLNERYSVQEIDYDAKFAQQIIGPLTDDGLPTAAMQQGWVTQSPALNELERAIVGKRFKHGGHPILRWCFSNISIHKDANNNRVIHKGASVDRVDGASATWMALSRAAANATGRSIYDSDERENGLLILEDLFGV